MAKKKLRNIIVAGTKFVWVFNPGYQILNAETSQYCCYDRFRAYASEHRTSPLEIIFITSEDPIYGGALRSGAAIVPSLADLGGVNLHTPQWAAILIRMGLEQGWQPHARSMPLTVDDGIQLLATLSVAQIELNADDDWSQS
jgi:hypothetical protein